MASRRGGGRGTSSLMGMERLPPAVSHVDVSPPLTPPETEKEGVAYTIVGLVVAALLASIVFSVGAGIDNPHAAQLPLVAGFSAAAGVLAGGATWALKDAGLLPRRVVEIEAVPLDVSVFNSNGPFFEHPDTADPVPTMVGVAVMAILIGILAMHTDVDDWFSVFFYAGAGLLLFVVWDIGDRVAHASIEKPKAWGPPSQSPFDSVRYRGSGY